MSHQRVYTTCILGSTFTFIEIFNPILLVVVIDVDSSSLADDLYEVEYSKAPTVTDIPAATASVSNEVKLFETVIDCDFSIVNNISNIWDVVVPLAQFLIIPLSDVDFVDFFSIVMAAGLIGSN